MFYLAKFCRICIKTDVELIDIATDKEDSIKLKKKLEECTKIVISKDCLSTKICTQCVEKLKVSYDFHEMCKNSSKLLQGILSKFLSDSDKVPENFTNTELRVTLSPLILPQDKSQENMSKNQGSSILKSLLSCENSARKSFLNINKSHESQRGGLRNIIAFTRSFDFGDVESNESSISKLVRFSEGFFKRDFSAFQRTVLYIIENDNNYVDDEDEMFENYPEEVNQMQFEEVIIEPDIRVKTEVMDTEESFQINSEEYQNTNLSIKREEEVEQDLIESLEITSSIPFMKNIEYLNELCSHRSFSQNSLRCRTRENPYINPHLKKQFMLRSFQCKKCPRYFKTPGYLKAHCAKVHNSLY